MSGLIEKPTLVEVAAGCVMRLTEIMLHQELVVRSVEFASGKYFRQPGAMKRDACAFLFCKVSIYAAKESGAMCGRLPFEACHSS